MLKNSEKVIEKFLDSKQGELFSFDKEIDLRHIKSKIFQNMAQTKSVDKFISNLYKHIYLLKKKDEKTIYAIKQFCEERKAINRVVRFKAHEKLSELKKQGDVEWLNQ